MMRYCVTTTMWWGIRYGMWACIKGVTLGIGFNDGKVAKFFSINLLSDLDDGNPLGVVVATRVVVTVTTFTTHRVVKPLALDAAK